MDLLREVIEFLMEHAHLFALILLTAFAIPFGILGLVIILGW